MRDAQKMGLKIERLPKEQWDIVWEIFRIFEEEILV
jgi:uncharacterized protein YjaG (DUF416 family)